MEIDANESTALLVVLTPTIERLRNEKDARGLTLIEELTSKLIQKSDILEQGGTANLDDLDKSDLEFLHRLLLVNNLTEIEEVPNAAPIVEGYKTVIKKVYAEIHNRPVQSSSHFTLKEAKTPLSLNSEEVGCLKKAMQLTFVTENLTEKAYKHLTNTLAKVTQYSQRFDTSGFVYIPIDSFEQNMLEICLRHLKDEEKKKQKGLFRKSDKLKLIEQIAKKLQKIEFE